MKLEPTENVKPELSANWSTPAPIPETEPDIEQNDIVPSISEQARLSGWECQYYSFGKLDDQGTDYFNPSLVMRDDGIWMLTRASGLHPRGFMYGQNAIVAFKLDDQGKQPHHGKILHWTDALQLQHFEDPRGFYHPRLGQTMMGCCTFMWNGPGDWTGALQVFGAFDDNWLCKKVDYPKIGGNPGKVEKVPHKDYEKNWVWWLHEDKLHLLYKANPWTVYVFENRWSEKTEYKIEGITWPYGEIRGGTAPVQVGDLFFTFHHSSLPWKGRYRRYYAGAIGFETVPPYRPKLITSEPLLQGSQNDVWAQRKPLVVFPCGALFLNGKWMISMGVNDMKSAWLELPHESLMERMRPVEDVSGQIFQSAVPSLTSLDPKTLELRAKAGREQAEEEDNTIQKMAEIAVYGATKEQITLEKRRAAAAKARAARAAKRVFHLPEDTQKLVDSHGTDGELATGGKWKVRTKKRRKQFSPEALENLRRAAAKARAARVAKRNTVILASIDGKMTYLPTSECPDIPKKRRRRRKYKRVTSEARQKALQEFESKKTLATEQVKA